MKNWIDIRRWIRPDQPQPNYKAALGTALWEAPLYVAIAAATLNCSVRTPERPKLEVTRHAWANESVYKATANLWEAPLYVPIGDAQRTGSVRTRERGTFDVRHTWVNEPVYKASVVLFDVDQVVAPVSAQQSSVRTPARPAFDIPRHTTKPQDAWIVSALAPDASVAQQAAIWSQLANPGATRARGGDVRRIQTEPIFSWPGKVVDAIVATWAPIFKAQESSRTGQRRVLDVRAVTDQPELSWLSSVITFSVSFTGKEYVVGSHLRGFTVTGHQREFTVDGHQRTHTTTTHERTFTVPMRKRTV